jgi:prevent-host-death family protein
MDVPVSDLRAHLRAWLERVRDGEEVTITERGAPVAKIVRVSSSALLGDLEKEGLLARPRSGARPPAGTHRRVRAKGAVADRVSSQRD